MLRTLRISALAGACLACFTLTAQSADLDPPQSYAPSSWYVRGDFGVAISGADNQPNTEAAFALGFGLGYRFSEMFRGDVTFDGAFDYGFGNGVDTYGVLANFYFDIPVAFIVTPYVGAGIGWGEADGNGVNDDGIAFAGMGGFTFDVSSNMAIDIGYKARYIDLEASKTGGVSYWLDHMVRAGIRYSF